MLHSRMLAQQQGLLASLVEGKSGSMD